MSKKRFFTSDTHWGDDRFDLFYRPFKTIQEQEDYLVEKWNSVVGPDDEVWHIGDFATTDEGLEVVKRLNGKIHLVLGNYDDPRPEHKLHELFESVWIGADLELKNGEKVFLNHYPDKACDDKFNIVGHIHGLWKVQRNMINVSTDAWHFTPVSEDQIIFCMNAIDKYYDKNVFAGELFENKVCGEVIYSDMRIPNLGPNIFLAGPTPRSLEVDSWRPKMIEHLRKAGYKGQILVPEIKNVEEGYDYTNQVNWEEEGLKIADLIVFWVPRDLKTMPGFTTNIEFGEWMKSGKVVLGYPEDAPGMKYMAKKAKDNYIQTHHTMEDISECVVEWIYEF